MTKRFILGLVAAFLLAVPAFATTRAAATCNTSDVQAAINLSSNGDTVTVPAGSCTWSSGVTFPGNTGIAVIGTGTPNTTPSTFGASSSCASGTVITVTGGTSFSMTPSAGNATSHISCMKLVAGGNAIAISALGSCSGSNCPNIRVDNLTFTGWQAYTHPGISYGITVVGDMFGVYDHNTITGVATNYLQLVEFSNASYLGTGLYGDYAWNQSEGYGTSNFLFVENNVFTSAGTSENEGSAGGLTRQGGGRIVARFNQYTVSDGINFSLGWHGTETAGRPRSTRAFEFYDNTYTCSPSAACGDVVASRGGTGYVWGNSVTHTSASLNNFYTMQTYRAFASIGGWGPCDGSSVYDTNDNTIYFSGTIGSYSGGVATISGSPGWTTNQWSPSGAPYSMHDVTQSNGGEITANGANTLTVNSGNGGPGTWTPAPGDSIQILRATACIDQAGGRGAGILFSGNPASPSASSAETPSAGYIFLNPVTGGAPVFSMASSSTARVIPGRDFYVETLNQTAQTSATSPFDGTNTIGVGHGTLANRPTTCTTGVGYWATDQGSWNTSGSGGQGVLYTCTSTNTWTLTYTPFTYPNPLITSGSGGSNFPYGSNCSGGCGIGTHIVTSSINITLSDTNGGDAPIQGATSLSGYPALPTTIVPSQLEVYWNTDTNADGCVIYGAQQSNSDRIQCEWADATHLKIGTSHHVTLKHLTPGSSQGPGGGPPTFYLSSNINDTTGVYRGRYDSGVNNYPGPLNIQGGPSAYFNVIPPNPPAAFPLQFEATPAGLTNARKCAAGYPSCWLDIPLNIEWLGANATSTSGFPTCDSGHLNQIGHVYQAGQPAGANNGTWYVCNGSTWNSLNGHLPAFVATTTTITNTGTGDVYTCPANANGGHDPSTFLPTGDCTGTAGDLGASVTPYYTGAVGTSTTDYRNVKYSSALNAYWFDTNGVSVPSNPVPTSVIEFYPKSTAVTGTFKLDVYLTVYTDESTLTTPAAGTSPVHFQYTFTVGTDGTVPQVDPGSYPADSNLPAFFSNVSRKSINSCSDASGGSGDTLDYFNLTQSYWMWLTFGAGDWNNYQIGNYDNARTFQGAQALFTKKMDGTAWPNWAPSSTYGNSYANMEVVDTNGHVWMATVSGGTSGGSITWPTTPTAGQTKTDNTQTWRYMGDAAYWNRCNENASMPFDNQVIQAGGSALWAQFLGAEDKNRQRTGDAIIKGTDTITGFYSKAETAQQNTSAWAGAFNPYSPGAGRGTNYELMAQAINWKKACDQGNCSAWTGNTANTRMVVQLQNAILNWWDLHRNSNAVVSDETLTAWPTFDPLHIGTGEEGLIEFYIIDKLEDPSNTLNLLDPRLTYEMQSFLDWMYFNWYDQCYVQGEGVHNYSFSYNPMDAQTCAILEPYFTELNGPVEGGYPWMGRFNGNQLMSDSSTTWFQASDSIRLHMYDGRTCNNLNCSATGVPFGGGSGVPKIYGQVGKWSINNSYQWRYGFWTPFEDDLSAAHNLCWDSGTMGCTGSHPYAATQQPYPVQIHSNGTEQDDPTCENNYTGDASCSPIQNIHSTWADFRYNLYDTQGEIASVRVDYGTTTSCSDGSTTTIEPGWPVLKNSNNQLTQWLLKMTPLNPSTQYYARACSTDNAGNTSCNPCASLGAFRGGGIKFTTSQQTNLIITTTTLPSGNVGNPYNATLTGAGGSGTYIWGWTGSTPPGLSLSTSGAITGTPTAGGTFNFNVTLNDSAGDPPATAPLTITISSIPVLAITTSSPLPTGTQGSSYSTTIAATGGVTPYTWTLLSVLQTNPGLALNASTGVLSSSSLTPSGKFNVSIKVADSNTPPSTVTKVFALTVTQTTSGITITTTSPLPDATAGLAYNEQFAATGGTGTLTWCVIENSTCDTGVNGILPAGLALSPSGALQGIAMQSGTYTFTVSVSDQANNTQTGVFSLTVDGTPLSITTPSLPGGTQGVAYNALVQAVGGATPYSWCIVETNGNCDNGSNGALPAGVLLTVDGNNNGVISGTPTQSGNFGFTIKVSDANGQLATKALSILIISLAPPSLAVSVSPNTMSLTQGAEGQATVTTTINSTFNAAVGLSMLGLPTGATATFDPNPIQAPGGGTSTLTLYAGPVTSPGTYNLSIQASGLGQNPVAPMTLTVTRSAPIVRVTTASLPAGQVMKLYPNVLLKAVGGNLPYTWTVSPSLPLGMKLTSGGVLGGFPKLSINKSYIFTATDHAGHQGSATLKLKITLVP